MTTLALKMKTMSVHTHVYALALCSMAVWLYLVPKCSRYFTQLSQHPKLFCAWVFLVRLVEYLKLPSELIRRLKYCASTSSSSSRFVSSVAKNTQCAVLFTRYSSPGTQTNASLPNRAACIWWEEIDAIISSYGWGWEAHHRTHEGAHATNEIWRLKGCGIILVPNEQLQRWLYGDCGRYKSCLVHLMWNISSRQEN